MKGEAFADVMAAGDGMFRPHPPVRIAAHPACLKNQEPFRFGAGRRHGLLRAYLVDGSPNNREVARAIRPVLESFLRVACPEHFPASTLLGPFHRLCADRVGSGREILDAETTRELHDLKEYANRFHHDTNPAWETEAINDGELRGFVERTLSFARP